MDTTINKIRELQHLTNQVTQMKQTLELFNQNSGKSDQIEYGCRVQLKYSDGTLVEGRVWGFSPRGEAQVNRDGYQTYMNCRLADLTNLSVGFIGELEKECWIKEQKIKALSQEISQARVDFIEFGIDPFINRSSLLVEVIDSKEIKNTTARLITLRKKNDHKIFKLVSSELNLQPGLYKFDFFMGVLHKTSLIDENAST